MNRTDMAKLLNQAYLQNVIACQRDGRGREGVVICVADTTGIILVCTIGEIPNPENEAKYRKNATEKALRVLQNPSHISSWQTRDPNLERWGGGVRLNDTTAVGVSGLSEHCDEAMALFISLYAINDVPNSETCTRVCAISENPHISASSVWWT